jgi:hypothetical protein
VVFSVVRCRSEDLLEERLGDRNATRVEVTGFAELLQRRVPLLVAGVGQALRTCANILGLLVTR